MQVNIFGSAEPKTKQEYLDACRAKARKLLATQLTITSEDVTESVKLPDGLHHNTIGNIFRHEDFVPVGYTLTRKNTSHKRLIRKWGLKDNWQYPRRTIKPVEYDSGD